MGDAANKTEGATMGEHGPEHRTAWSCEHNSKRGNCRNPYGCHCREITGQVARIAALEAELAEAKAERDDYQAQHKELLVAAVHSQARATAAEARAEKMKEAHQRIISHETDHPNATVKRIVAISRAALGRPE